MRVRVHTLAFFFICLSVHLWVGHPDCVLRCQPVGGNSESKFKVQNWAWSRCPRHSVWSELTDACVEVLGAVFNVGVSDIPAEGGSYTWDKKKSLWEGCTTGEQVVPVGWVSLNKVTSKRTEDPWLQGLHQLCLVIQQLPPFILDEVSFPRILGDRLTSDHIDAFQKIPKDTQLLLSDHTYQKSKRIQRIH